MANTIGDTNFSLKQCSYRLRPSRDNYTEIALCQVGSVLP